MNILAVILMKRNLGMKVEREDLNKTVRSSRSASEVTLQSLLAYS